MANEPTDLSDSTAAPISVTVGDATYEASPLTIGDWGALQEWIREGIRAEGVRAASNADTDELRELVLDRSDRKADTFTLFDIEADSEDPKTKQRAEQAERMLSTPRVMFYLLWLSLRHKHPKLKREAVGAIVEKCKDSLVSLCERILQRSMTKTTKDGGSQPADPTT